MMCVPIIYKVQGQSQKAADFKLTDTNGKIVWLTDFRGKVVVLDFWFTGCINCMNFYRTSLSDAERHYNHNPQVVFVSVCIDKERDKWRKSLEKGKYTSATSVNLYTDGLGDQHPVIKQYNVGTYPQPIVIEKNGNIISRSEHLTEPGELIKAIGKAIN